MQLKVMLLPLLLLAAGTQQAAVLPQEIGYLELKPNGTLILQHAPNVSGGGNLQNLLLLRSVLQALKLQPGEQQNNVNIRIYGDGVEQKFPPVLENIIQRIQTFFSIYRYTDTSRPIRKDELTTEATPNFVTTQSGRDPMLTQTEQQGDIWITVGED